MLPSEIVDVAAGKICELFRPRSPEVPAHLSPAVELPVSTPEHNGFNLPVPQHLVVPTPPTPPADPTSIEFEVRVDEMPHLLIPESSTAPDVGAVPELTREPESIVVPASPTLIAEPPSIGVQTRMDVTEERPAWMKCLACGEVPELTRTRHPLLNLHHSGVQARVDVRALGNPDSSYSSSTDNQ